ncbi:N-acetylmuramoyl-L-alanine amidase [Candidatus Desulfosporosinus infrequens]|uniref:N-acetylmuramoyl-L-alanine amidase n=1 Tax=Candidatus Desulfosporosinus infrequens TaxID=2043169 RepID=A0A2U3L5R2_9FIRM|nr:N-acetylmuramoyl-L-alanine amidase [Candidatus Desulfosporosinus infrequens]
MSYTIEQNFIPGLPKEPYDAGYYVGVVAHATANNGDSADGERNYESTTWQNAFVHFFVDDLKVEQVADTNFLCYGAGHTANHMGYAQVELCQTTDSTKFAKAYDMYTWLLAKLLYNRKLCVVDGVTLMSHEQVSAKWHETTHTDPIDYLTSHGKTWATLVADVTANYNEMEGGETVEEGILIFGPDDFVTAKSLAATLKNEVAIFMRKSDGTAPTAIKSAKHLYVVGGDQKGVGHPNETVLAGVTWFDTVAAVAKKLGY